MQQKPEQRKRTEPAVAEAPSPEFIRAVADLLDTSPEDILTEMGYSAPETREPPIQEPLLASQGWH